jgi:hypothetical protein
MDVVEDASLMHICVLKDDAKTAAQKIGRDPADIDPSNPNGAALRFVKPE